MDGCSATRMPNPDSLLYPPQSGARNWPASCDTAILRYCASQAAIILWACLQHYLICIMTVSINNLGCNMVLMNYVWITLKNNLESIKNKLLSRTVWSVHQKCLTDVRQINTFTPVWPAQSRKVIRRNTCSVFPAFYLTPETCECVCVTPDALNIPPNRRLTPASALYL